MQVWPSAEQIRPARFGPARFASATTATDSDFANASSESGRACRNEAPRAAKSHHAGAQNFSVSSGHHMRRLMLLLRLGRRFLDKELLGLDVARTSLFLRLSCAL
jgi:hypothetical protein